MSELWAFAVISLLLVISPGPNSVLVVKTVAGQGVRASVENIFGLVSATFVHGAISILGLSAIILQSAEIFTIVKYIGAAYLLYLGMKTILASLKKSPVSQECVSVQLEKSKFYQNYIEGFLTQLLNPKVSMFYLAAFPQFISLENTSYLWPFLLVAIHASIIFAWFMAVSIFLSKVKHQSRSSRFSIWFQRVSGGALVYFGTVLATQEINR